MIYSPVALSFKNSTAFTVPSGALELAFNTSTALWEPPAYNTVNFTWVSALEYTPPAYNAVDFSFEPATNFIGAATVGGTSATGFQAYYALEPIVGTSATAFVGAQSGYQAGTVTIPGTAAVDIKVIAYQSGAFTIVTPEATTNFPYHVLAAGTYSLYDHIAQTSFPTTSFSGGTAMIANGTSTYFEPIYGAYITAQAAVDGKFGGMMTQPMSSAGIAADALGANALRAGFIAPVCVAGGLLYAARVKPTYSVFAGTTIESFLTNELFGASSTIDGATTTLFPFGGMRNGSSTIDGATSTSYISSSYHVVSTTIYASGELIYYIGGILDFTHSIEGRATVADDSEQLRMGVLASAGITLDATFNAATRLQALIYDVFYTTSMPQDWFAAAESIPLAVLTANEDAYCVDAPSETLFKSIPSDLWVRTDVVDF